MNNRVVLLLLLSSCFFTGRSSAQGRAPAGPPPGGPPGLRGPGGSAGPGGPSGSNGQPGSPGGRGSNNVPSSQTAAVQHFGPVGRWWDDKSVVRTIGLSAAQQKQMDRIFDGNKPAILSAYKSFLAQQTQLDALSKQPQVDQARLFAAIDSVSQAKVTLEKANTQMLLQIRQQMNLDQITKLEHIE